MVEILEIPLASIEVGSDRARDIDPVWAECLAGTMAAQGLKHPITVRVIGGVTRLIAGRYRLEAARILGWDTIPCIISTATSDDAARLEEVMENLGRAELIALDRCHHLYELKRVYDLANPEASRPGRRVNGKSFPISDDQPEAFGLASTVADKVGLSKRYINLSVKIWKGLAPQTRARLSGTDLATKHTELKALSEIPTPAKQAKVLDLILGDVHPVHNVAQALEFLDSGKVPSAIEKAFVKVSATLAALDDEAFEGVILANEDRVIASLKRRGRI